MAAVYSRKKGHTEVKDISDGNALFFLGERKRGLDFLLDVFGESSKVEEHSNGLNIQHSIQPC